MVAAIRPSDVELPLFLHVLGAMLLVGALLVVAVTSLRARRLPEPDAVPVTRFALRALLIGVIPAYVLMRVGAQWTEAAADYPDDFDPAWIGIGYITADAGVVLILISAILSGIGLRRLRRGSGSGLGTAVGVISALLLAAYLVAVWAMTAKPT